MLYKIKDGHKASKAPQIKHILWHVVLTVDLAFIAISLLILLYFALPHPNLPRQTSQQFQEQFYSTPVTAH